jgi:hypothetical protein
VGLKIPGQITIVNYCSILITSPQVVKEMTTLMVYFFATECPFYNFDSNKFYKLKTGNTSGDKARYS